MKNKGISLILCASLISSPVFLQADSEMTQLFEGGGFSNVTKGGKVESVDGTTGFYGGSVTYRFNNEMDSYAPWVDLQAPSAKFGCNGFDINVGFANFTGIADIAQQLGGASQAAIWGLLVGLVNSMPTLEHIFSKIKAWVDWMQNLVRDACNVGSAISSTIMAQSGATSTMQKLVDEPGDLIASPPDHLKEKIRKSLTGENSKATENADDISRSYGDSVYGSIYFVRGKVGDLLAKEFLKNETEFKSGSDDKRKEWREFHTKVISGGSSNKDQYLLLVNLFGEEAVSGDYLKFIDEKGSIIPDLIALGKIEKTKNASKKNIALEREVNQDLNAAKGSSEGDPTKMKKILAVKMLPPPNLSEQFITDILWGTENKKLYLYPVTIIHSQVMDKSGFLYNLLAAESFGSEKVSIPWEGLVEESRKLIKCELNKSNCSKSNAVTLVVPGGQDILETIFKSMVSEDKTKVVKDGDGFGPQALNYIDILAKENAKYFAKFMIQNSIDKWLKNSSSNREGEASKVREETIKMLKSYMAEIDKSIDIDKDYIKLFKDVKAELQKERNKK